VTGEQVLVNAWGPVRTDIVSSMYLRLSLCPQPWPVPRKIKRVKEITKETQLNGNSLLLFPFIPLPEFPVRCLALDVFLSRLRGQPPTSTEPPGPPARITELALDKQPNRRSVLVVPVQDLD
jgi:hypothetical protein